MDESTESVILLHGIEIRRLEKQHNMLTMELSSLDYEEITDYLKHLQSK